MIMLTKQEQKILDDAPDIATHYMTHKVHDIEYGVSHGSMEYAVAGNSTEWFLLSEWEANSLSDLRNKGASKASLAQRKPLHGVGINDAQYDINPLVNGKHQMCPTYRKWRNMLSRCYSRKYQDDHPTYEDCTVCDEWLTFSAFAGWIKDNYIDDCELDKDIKVKGNKIYSPETCLLVPKRVNLLLTDNASRRGVFPQGVSFHKRKGKYRAQIRIDGKQLHLGYFSVPEEAREAYVISKSKEIKRKCEQYPQFAKYLINHLPSKKQGKTVVDAVNHYQGSLPDKTGLRAIISDKTGVLSLWYDDDVSFINTACGYYLLCTIEEFNQCVKDMSEFAGVAEYEQYLAHIDIFGIEKLEPIKDKGYKLFVDRFRGMVKSGNLEALNELSYMANQLAEKGGCGSFDIGEQEPIKPSTKVEYVKVDGLFWNIAKEYKENKGSIFHKSGENYFLIKTLESLVKSHKARNVYRKVETEIKTEKRWITYNTKTDECYPCGETQTPASNCQIIEITVEV